MSLSEDIESSSQKKTKVLFLASWYPSRLNPVHAQFIERHACLIATFADVKVLFCELDADLREKTFDFELSEENGVEVMRVFFAPVRARPRALARAIEMTRYFLGYLAGYKRIREGGFRPDLVHVNVSYPAGLLALYLKKIYDIPYIITEHYSKFAKYCNDYLRFHPVNKFFIKRIFKNAAEVTTVSRFLAESIKELGLYRKEIIITPNVVNIPSSNGENKEKDKKGKILALSVSFLDDKKKNVSSLIDAFSRVAANHNNLELHIIGEGVDKESLMNKAKTNNMLNSHIFFHGSLTEKEVGEFYRKSHFFVLNSNFETFSVATAEAIAHGLPVIVTRCGGPEEFVTDETGMLVERANTTELTKAIQQMVLNWESYEPVNLKKYARKKFDADDLKNTFKKTYLKTLEHKSRSSG